MLFFVFAVLLRSDSGFYTLNSIELDYYYLLFIMTVRDNEDYYFAPGRDPKYCD